MTTHSLLKLAVIGVVQAGLAVVLLRASSVASLLHRPAVALHVSLEVSL